MRSKNTGKPTKKNPKKHSRTLANNLFALRWLFRITPGYMIYRTLFEMIDSVCIVFEHTFLVAYIIYCIENQKGMHGVMLFFVPLSCVILIRMLLAPYVETHIRPKIDEKINREVKMQLYEKAAKMEISRYDDPTFYNDFIWAMREAPSHISGAFLSFHRLTATLASGVVVGAFMFSTDAIGFLVVALSITVTFLCRSRLVRVQMRRDETLMPNKRKSDYIARVFYLPDYAKDLRNSRMSKKLFSDYKQSADDMQNTVNTYGRRLTLFEYLSLIFKDVLLFDGVYISYLLYQGLHLGNLGYGIMVALYNSSNAIRRNLDNVIRSIPEFQQHSLFIEKLRTFLDAENQLTDAGKTDVPSHGDLHLEHVSFSYPGSDTETLRDISLHINRGDKIALVGYNGAGKSTLIKLLMRLYDPTSGTVQFDGKPLSDYPLQEYRRRFGTVFQEYEIIAATLGENVAMSAGNLHEEKVLDIFDRVDFITRFDSFAQGLATPMTKEFDNDGVNLSGGEAQKVALSRVLYSDASILIFDEPSSALDPIAEYRLNRTILEIAKEKTVIIITHRLSTTKFVDNIYMFEDGSIIESGSHDDLIARDGKYAEMFHLQAQKYR